MEMQGTNYKTKEEVFKRGQEIIGKPLGSIDKTGRLATGKGAVGTVIEESWFGYQPNNIAEPDFPEAKVELKVFPYVKTKNGIRAKERVVCDIINYMEEYGKTFETSDFWKKCETLLLMTYEYRDNISKEDYKIEKVILFGFPYEDLVIIKHDWEIIVEKIKAGQAHLLTEGDTMYLAACTKGATAATSMKQQPFNEIKAKQRAYSLKSSYMTSVLRNYMFGSDKDEHIIKDWHDLEKHPFEEIIINRLRPYYGKSQAELKREFNIKTSPKNINALLLARMLDISDVNEAEEFEKANIIPKTIRIQKNGKIKESMSFPAFKFTEIINETWEDSTLKNYLEPAKFLFVIFRESSGGNYVFEKAKFWNIPSTDLEEVHKVWSNTVSAIKDGVVIKPRGFRISNNLPKQRDNPVAHVRPHAKNRHDTYPLPDGRLLTKQCFWLNNKYILSQLEIE